MVFSTPADRRVRIEFVLGKVDRTCFYGGVHASRQLASFAKFHSTRGAVAAAATREEPSPLDVRPDLYADVDQEIE